MVKAAVTELQQQIEVRRDSYAAGYAAAMQVMSVAASRPAPKAGTTVAGPSRRGRGRVRQAAPAAKPTRPRRSGASETTRPSANGRAQRGTNALIIEEILKAMSPSPVRPGRSARHYKTTASRYPSPRSTTRCANWKRATRPSSPTARVGVIGAAPPERRLNCGQRIGVLFMPARVAGCGAAVRACRI